MRSQLIRIITDSTGDIDPPKKTNWRVDEQFDSFTLHYRGRWTWLGTGMLTFATFFWNGVVAIIAWENLFKPGVPKGDADWWGQLFFLSIFAAIGLFFIVLDLLALAEPFHTIRWTLNPETFTCRDAYFGMGKTWRYAAAPLSKIELRLRLWRDEKKRRHKPGTKLKVSQEDREQGMFFLVLLDQSEQEICHTGSLSLADARWLAREIIQNCRRLQL